MKSKRVLNVLIILASIVIASGTLLAHSGRTDKYGGHNDNKNVSGLGSYHYHCGGHKAHLHTNGVCPYDSNEDDSNEDATTKKISYTEEQVNFNINGESININAINSNDRKLVELRTICNQLGIKIVDYDSQLKSITCRKDTNEFILQIDSKNMWRNNELVLLDIAPVEYKGKTMVPARIVAEAIGKTVTYDTETKSIIIN